MSADPPLTRPTFTLVSWEPLGSELSALANGTMALIGRFGLNCRIIIDINHIVQHAYRGGDCSFKFLGVNTFVADVGGKIDRTQIAYRGFFFGSV